jgi:replicative DNA helicase
MNTPLDFGSHFLDMILFNAIINTEFCSKIRNLVDEKIFKTREKKHILKLIYDYYDNYKEAPKDHFWDIFEESKDYIPNTLYERCEKLIGILSDLGDGNIEYVTNTIKEAIRHISIQEGIFKSAELLKKKQYDQIENVMLKALKKSDEIEKGYYDFLQDKSYIERRGQGKQFKVKTLIPALDKEIGGLDNWLVTILGKTKGGKTKLLIELTVNIAQQGKKVLFVSKEMSKSEIEDGFDQCISFLGSDPGREIEIMEPIKDGWRKRKKIIPTIFDLDKVKKGRNALGKLGGKIYIVDKSSTSFNYLHFESLLNEMEQKDGIILDASVIDYLGEMDATEKGQKKKEKIAANASGLKSIGKQRFMLIITAAQGNRKAMSAKTFEPEMISDAIEPIFISDLVLAICQTSKEEKMSIYRIYVCLFRHGPKGAIIYLVRDTNIGQIALGVPSKQMITEAQAAPEDKIASEEDTGY